MDKYTELLKEFGEALENQGPPRDLKGKHIPDEEAEQYARWAGLFEPLPENEIEALGHPHRARAGIADSRCLPNNSLNLQHPSLSKAQSGTEGLSGIGESSEDAG